MVAAVNALHGLCKTLQTEWQQPVITRHTPEISKDNMLNQQVFWSHIQHFLRPDDIVVTDQGTSCFGAAMLNNQGYTVERAIHGPQQRYNDIAAWNWTQLPQALAAGKESFTRRVTEVEQLQQVLAQIENAQQLTFIEVVLPPMDMPELLKSVTKSIEARNTTI